MGLTPLELTDRLERVYWLARGESIRLRHDCIGTQHLLLGLLKEGTGVAIAVIRRLGLSEEKIKSEVEKVVPGEVATMMMGEVPYTPKAKRAMQLAAQEAERMGHKFVGTEHLLLGLIGEGEGIAAQVLSRLGITLEVARKMTEELLAGPGGGK